MSLQQIKRQWDALGNLDPLWAMTGTNKFNAWDLEAFLRTGDRQVDQLLAHVKRYNVPHGHECHPSSPGHRETRCPWRTYPRHQP